MPTASDLFNEIAAAELRNGWDYGIETADLEADDLIDSEDEI